jgi:hypothetical protein
VQLGKRLRHIEGDLDKLDAQMLEPTRKDQNMAKQMEHLIGIAALGHVSMRCGQREKDSIAAVMHKQLVPANTLLRDNPKWAEKSTKTNTLPSRCDSRIQTRPPDGGFLEDRTTKRRSRPLLHLMASGMDFLPRAIKALRHLCGRYRIGACRNDNSERLLVAPAPPILKPKYLIMHH